MDPDEVLHRLRMEAQGILRGEESSPAAMAEAFEALDQWLSNGGFLPSDWAVKRQR